MKRPAKQSQNAKREKLVTSFLRNSEMANKSIMRCHFFVVLFVFFFPKDDFLVYYFGGRLECDIMKYHDCFGLVLIQCIDLLLHPYAMRENRV